MAENFYDPGCTSTSYPIKSGDSAEDDVQRMIETAVKTNLLTEDEAQIEQVRDIFFKKYSDTEMPHKTLYSCEHPKINNHGSLLPTLFDSITNSSSDGVSSSRNKYSSECDLLLETEEDISCSRSRSSDEVNELSSTEALNRLNFCANDAVTLISTKKKNISSNRVPSSLACSQTTIKQPKKQPPQIFLTKEVLHKSKNDPVEKWPNQPSPVKLLPPPLTGFSSNNNQNKVTSPVSKCTLKLDGYSYMIVASPPNKLASTSQPSVACQESKNGQLSKQGSLTILRRSSSKRFTGRNARLAKSDDEYLDGVDLECDNLPSIDTPEAAEKAALRLRVLLRRLQQGEIPASALQKNLQYAADVLETGFIDDIKRIGDEEDELSEVEPDAVPPEVREWLASTFTKQLQGSKRRNEEKPKFRSVANAIRAGIFVERIYRRLSSATYQQLPPEVTSALKRVDEWSFDVWALQDVSSNTPLRCLAYEFLNRYGFLHKFKVPPASLEAFLQQVEAGYCKYKNPYHNNVHAADVLQTIHYMLSQTGLMNWLTDVEVFATLMAALIHDYEHTGTTNNYHVMSGSNTALLYNDRAVLENHHISAAFRLLQGEETNILVNLSKEEYKEFRTLVIDMVLATDMSSHFQQIKAMKTLLTLPEPTLDKNKALSMVLHCCDISHPSKMWRVHEKWTTRLLEEFFRQGDMEKAMGLPYSPLCDRNNTLVAQSQIGFIDFIVDPSMSVCGDLLDKIASVNAAGSSTIAEESEPGGPIKRPTMSNKEVKRPWEKILVINKGKWKERATKDAEERAQRELIEAVGNAIAETEEEGDVEIEFQQHKSEEESTEETEEEVTKKVEESCDNKREESSESNY